MMMPLQYHFQRFPAQLNERAWASRWFLIGNDIIDLQYLEWPPYQHVRYLERVCTSVEADAVRRSSNPSRSLAAVWAAKEAAYKLTARASKLMHFVPREFVTDFSPNNSWASELRVLGHGTQTGVSIFETAQWLHAVARSPRCGDLQWRVREIDKGSWHQITPAVESATARQLAKELLQACDIRNVELDFAGNIPTLRNAGQLDSERAISLSHHGRFVAVAIGWATSKLLVQEEVIGSLAPGASSRAA